MDAVHELGTGVLAVAAAGVFLGTLLQRLAGQGFGMLAAPIVALVAPAFLPATLLILGILVGLSATAVEWRALDLRELPPGLAGRALGAAAAAWLATRVTGPDGIALLVAGAIYLGVALSLVGARVPIVPPTLFAAGVTAGVMGTLTAVGAPPMALLYQHEKQQRAAAMQNAFFLWGMAVSIAALAVAGLVGWRHLALAALLAPAALLGLVVAQPLSRRIAQAAIRPWALGLAALAATGLLIARL